MREKRLKTAERVFALLMAALLLAGGFLGFRTMQQYEYCRVEDWQDTADFENLLYRYIDRAMILVSSELRLKEDGQLSYLERQQLENSVEEQRAELSVDRTWFRYQVRHADGTVADPGNLGDADMKRAVHAVHFSPFPRTGRVPGEGMQYETYEDFDMIELPLSGTEGQLVELQPGEGQQTDILIIECGVPYEPDGEQMEDEFTALRALHKDAWANFGTNLYWTAGLLTGAALCLLLVLILAGKQAAQEDHVPGRTDRLWLELYLAAAGAAAALCIAGLLLLGDKIIYSIYFGSGPADPELLMLASCACGGLTLGAGLFGAAALRTVVVRAAGRTFVRSTLLYRLYQLCRKLAAELTGAIPALWRTVLGFGLLTAVNALAFTGLGYSGLYMAFWLLVNLAALLYLCRWALCFRRLREGCRTIAAGNLNHRIDTAKMPYDLRDHGEDLNNISQGLSGAVEERIKSERFKAELITNVSHDLKTPLTSIINYVELLKTTDQTDPRAKEYIGVLDRKSLRLKKLTEDLVEASKASTGMLTVNKDKIGMVQLLDQARGEWEEKLLERSLTVVPTLPEEEAWVYADGRHLWRVIDNLLANCCKYAMEGTRIYIDLSRSKGQVVLSVKNISREPLNIPAERLLERFVRGEESRSTEGSGLGLSIAKSLTELQGGAFELSVDGDLFKAVVSLPQAV